MLAAAAAGLYPIIHLGRPWFFYWNLPYPNNLDLWPQFRSPLVWDAFDIISFLIVALLFWYVGMIPDLATLRDRATRLRRKQIYGVAALGWRGSAVHWARWLQAYRILALLGVLQAICTQCGASVMYAGTLEPGWHSTLAPAFYIINAAFSGIALVAVVVTIVRYIYPIESLITDQHLDMLGRVLLAVGLLSTYCYLADFFFTSLGGDAYDRSVMVRRLTGLYASSFWLIVAAALLPIHLLWFRSVRRSALMLFLLGILVMAGMWGDHFMELVVTQHRRFPALLPGALQHRHLGGRHLGRDDRVVRRAAAAGAALSAGRVDHRVSASGASAGGGPAAWLSRRNSTASRRSLPRKTACSPPPRSLRERRFGVVDTYSPLPVPGMEQALALRAPPLGWVALAGALLGGLACFGTITFATVADYPFNIAARPLWSWPYYVIPSFAFAMLCGAVLLFVAMLFLDRLPRINHPVFNIDGIEGVTQDRLFIVVEARTDDFDPNAVERALIDLPDRPLRIQRVPR